MIAVALRTCKSIIVVLNFKMTVGDVDKCARGRKIKAVCSVKSVHNRGMN